MKVVVSSVLDSILNFILFPCTTYLREDVDPFNPEQVNQMMS
ncbi:hypothetical protein L292_0403 [Acinetobacter junii CIP 107470 = MTCC 11364]|uniref:Uncharacterized protein n=1 Tax=Acinetobacter junii CIP 107470 = MTCC 11364 TaxID=1217666 RepID=S7WPM5_ACIJU|nr:hypothetical protein L292_0403 [Acinetobacter junii CIP 107470 = MTCC 11364]